MSEPDQDDDLKLMQAPPEMSASDQDDDLKLIKLNSARIDEPDAAHAAEYPHKLMANLAPPELMQVTFVMLHGGSEELVVRGRTRESLDRFIALNDLRQHPRLRWMRVITPDGAQEEVQR